MDVSMQADHGSEESREGGGGPVGGPLERHTPDDDGEMGCASRDTEKREK